MEYLNNNYIKIGWSEKEQKNKYDKDKIKSIKLSEKLEKSEKNYKNSIKNINNSIDDLQTEYIPLIDSIQNNILQNTHLTKM